MRRTTRGRVSGCRIARLQIAGLLMAVTPLAAAAQTPNLQSAETFGVLAGASVSSTGTTTVGGDVGVGKGGSITGDITLGSGGAIHEGDAVAVQALLDASISSTDLAAQTCSADNPPLTGNIATGVYCFDGDATTAGAVNLTGAGPWVFLIDGSLTVTHEVSVTSSADPAPQCHGSSVFWVVAGDATIGAPMVGNVLANGANGVTLQAGATQLDGRAIALDPGAAVTLNGNTVQACSFGRRLPLFDPVKVTGGGQINVPDPDSNGVSNYGLNARPDGNGGATGHLNYRNHVSRLHVNGTVTDIAVLTLDPGSNPDDPADDAPKLMRFSGTCANGPDCTFSVTVEDNGEPATDDRFGIVVVGSDADESTPLRVVKNGNLQVHLGLTTSLNDDSFGAGEVMSISATMTPGRGSSRVDAYVVLELPNGQLLSFTPRGFVPGLTPLATNIAPVNFRTHLADLVVPPGTPPGTYRWLSGHTAPGTLNLLSEISVRQFTVKP